MAFMFVSPPFSWERCEWIYVLCRELGMDDESGCGEEGWGRRGSPVRMTPHTVTPEVKGNTCIWCWDCQEGEESGRRGKDNSWMARKTHTCKHSSLGCSVLRAQAWWARLCTSNLHPVGDLLLWGSQDAQDIIYSKEELSKGQSFI